MAQKTNWDSLVEDLDQKKDSLFGKKAFGKELVPEPPLSTDYLEYTR